MRDFFHVEDLPRQRQHRLGVAVAPLLGRAAREVTLDDEQLGERGVLDEQRRSLPGKRRVLRADLRLVRSRALRGRLAERAGLDRTS